MQPVQSQSIHRYMSLHAQRADTWYADHEDDLVEELRGFWSDDDWSKATRRPR